VNPAPFSIDIGTSENFVLNANGGDDTFSGSNGLAALIQLTVDGGTGNDVILGGDGSDLLIGGDGNDVIDGNRGDDVALMGAGDDVFIWDPGDGSDVVEGQGGFDAMHFNGANVSENIDISANGGRIRFFRNVANIVMDLNDVEDIAFNALGGADNIVVNDVSGTDLVQVELNLSGTLGGTSGDSQVDTVTLNGSNGNDITSVLGTNTSYAVVGLAALVQVGHSEPIDRLIVNANGGNDSIFADTLGANVVGLTIDGGAGNDHILGGNGNDVLIGGDGNDVIDGNRGDDVAFMGAGNDIFIWDPGDGSDVVEGQSGTDKLLFNGANASENIDISANGSRVRFFRDVANIVMDLDDVEGIEFNALGGADNIVVNDLSGTDVTDVRLNLNNAAMTGDGQADSITVNGTAGNDNISIDSTTGDIRVLGFVSAVTIVGAEGANDSLTINSLGGSDVVNASQLAAGRIKLTMNGGDGNDLLIGSQGDDLINGGRGDDVALMGAGDDAFVWNPGDGSDILEGQAGVDRMIFNGANVSENIDISANGGRVRFFRNVANIVMDLNDVEGIDFNALGGADNIVVYDLSGTDVADINLNLAGTLGGSSGDGQADRVTVNGTNGDDVILVAGDAAGTQVLGLAATVTITAAETSNDVLAINALGGDDVVEASNLKADGISLIADGGPGLDVRDGLGGDNIEIQ
jgi:Ca2+-binding RTX toxin-like protein